MGKGQTETGHRDGERRGEGGGIGEGVHRRETRSSMDEGRGESALNEGRSAKRMGAHGQGWNFRTGASLKIHATRNTTRELESAHIHACCGERPTNGRTFGIFVSRKPSETIFRRFSRSARVPARLSMDLASCAWLTTRVPLIVRHSTIRRWATIIMRWVEPLLDRGRFLTKVINVTLYGLVRNLLNEREKIETWSSF